MNNDTILVASNYSLIKDTARQKKEKTCLQNDLDILHAIAWLRLAMINQKVLGVVKKLHNFPFLTQTYEIYHHITEE